MAVIYSAGAPILRGMNAEEDYSLAITAPTYEAVGATTATSPTNKDITYSGRTTSGTRIKSDIVATSNANNPSVQFESLTPAVCSVDSLGRVTRVADGGCTVRGRGQTGVRQISQTIDTIGVQTIYDTVTARGAFSLRKYLYDQQIAALVGVTPGSAAQRAHAILYNSGTGSSVNTGNFIRAQSKAGFAALPLTALDELLVGAGGSTQWKAWISPRHFLTWRGHGSVSSAGNWVSLFGEIVVEYSTTPWAGALCQLLPSNWRTFMPDSLNPDQITDIALWTRHLHTYDAGEGKRWVMPSSLGLPVASVFSVADTRRAYQKLYNNELLSTNGDSGSPAFLGINGKLVPVGHTTSYGAVCTAWFGDYRAEIDAAMATLNASGLYTAESVVLTGFTAYP